MAVKDINTPENIARMTHIKKEIERVVLKYRENTEAAIVAGACIQIARTLLSLYPERLRKELTEGAVMLLEGYVSDQETKPTIIIPAVPKRRM